MVAGVQCELVALQLHSEWASLLLSLGQFLDKVLWLRWLLWSEEGRGKDDSQVLWAHQVGGLILGHSEVKRHKMSEEYRALPEQ